MQEQVNVGGVQFLQSADEIGQRAAETIDAPGHDHVKLLASRVLQGVTRRFVQNCTLTVLTGRRGRLRRRRGGLRTGHAADSPPGATRDTQYPIWGCTDFIDISA